MAKLKAVIGRMPAGAKVAASAAVGVLVATGYFFGFHMGLTEDISNAVSLKAGLKKKLVVAQDAEKVYRKDLAELAERETRQKALSQILPETTEYPAFLSAVQAAANVSGVKLSAWTPQKRVPDEFYARVPMKVELTGRFHQVARFFYNVGQLDRIINMENISMTQPKMKNDEVILTTSALATAFHASPPEEKTNKKKRKSRRRKGK